MQEEKKKVVYRQESEITDREMIEDVAKDVRELKRRMGSVERENIALESLVISLSEILKCYISKINGI